MFLDASRALIRRGAMTVGCCVVAVALRLDALTRSWKQGNLWIIQGYQAMIMLWLILGLTGCNGNFQIGNALLERK